MTRIRAGRAEPAGADPVPTVLGADGCRGGWLFAALGYADEAPRLEVVPSLARLVECAPALCFIDMPMGLSEHEGSRECDRLLRAQHGVRAATVFNPPVRGAMTQVDHRSASETNRCASGKGLSIQSWNLVPRIRELDGLLRDDPDLCSTVRESHPEWLFALLGRAAHLSMPLPPKRVDEGRRLRLQLLQREAPALSVSMVQHVSCPPIGATADDALDALVLALAARRALHSGTVGLPSSVPRDAFGIPMEIVAPQSWVLF